MLTLARLVFFGRAIQGRQYGQCPGAAQSRQLYQDCQYHPLVAPPPGRVRMRRSYGVAMPSFAIDFLSAMLRDRVVAADRDRAAGKKAVDHLMSQNPRQIPTRPTPLRKHAVVAGPVTLGQTARNSQQTTDRMPTDTENCREHQHLKPRPDRLREFARPLLQDRTNTLWYLGHLSFLARRDSRFVSTRNLPARRLFLL